MKKLFFIFIILLTLISCKQNEPTDTENEQAVKDYPAIEKSLWDAENISLTNTQNTEFVNFPRRTGTNGIIGKFGDENKKPESLCYYFYKNGYFEYKRNYREYTTGSNYVDRSEGFYGTYVIKTINLTDDYFALKLQDERGNSSYYFYQVSSRGFSIFPYIIIDSISYYPQDCF